MGTPEENTAIAQRFFNEIATVPIADMDYVSDNIQWLVAGSRHSPFFGKYPQGKEAVQRCIDLNNIVYDQEKTQANLTENIAQGNKVLFMGWEKNHYNLEQTGQDTHVSYNAVWVFTFEDDKIIKYELLYGIAVDGIFGYTEATS